MLVCFMGRQVKALRDKASHCAYTGDRFTEENPPSYEHIRPRSKRGTKRLSNGLVVTQDANARRGDTPFPDWLRENPGTADHIQDYLDEMRGTRFGDKDYVEAVKPTLNREARGVAHFSGRKLNISV